MDEEEKNDRIVDLEKIYPDGFQGGTSMRVKSNPSILSAVSIDMPPKRKVFSDEERRMVSWFIIGVHH